MEFGKILKKLRKMYNMTQDQLSEKLDVANSTISMYERGARLPDMEMLTRIAEIFNVDINYLFGQSSALPSARPIATRKLPLLGNVACGEPIFTNEEHETYIDASSDIDADFCLTAKGDSMINARIFDGDILFVKNQQTVNDGEIAVVIIEDEATVKRVFYDRESNIITLIPENPMYKPMRYVGAELDRVNIIGKVTTGQYKVK